VADLQKIAVVTGAFSFTGQYVTRLMLERGWQVRTITHHPDRPHTLAERVEAFPYDFDRPDKLRHTLRGASTLVNTYWVRFPRGAVDYTAAARDTQTLVDAARDAGLQRIAHVSIANASADSSLGYYRGKAETERAVIASGLGYAIVRPTVIFGVEDILINNIAWFVRHFPAFAIPGDGRYGIRPIFVEDLARLLVDGAEGTGDTTADAVGPESFAFEELVRTVASQLGRHPRLVHLPGVAAHALTSIAGALVGDVVLTLDESQGLQQSLLAVDGPATGRTSLTEWLAEYRDRVGIRYASELARHYTGVVRV
jgi:uncharacterized protein YbjT (DUF2867 family)